MALLKVLKEMWPWLSMDVCRYSNLTVWLRVEVS